MNHILKVPVLRRFVVHVPDVLIQLMASSSHRDRELASAFADDFCYGALNILAGHPEPPSRLLYVDLVRKPHMP